MHGDDRSTSGTRIALRWIASAVVIAVAALGLVATSAGAAPTGNKVLIMSESVQSPSHEAQYLAGLGLTVEYLPGAQWSTKSTAYFSEFRALVIGDTGNTPAAVFTSYLAGSKAAWAPAVTGNIFIAGADPVGHSKWTLIDNGLSYAVNDSANTGLYITTGDNFPNNSAPVLDGLGAGWAGENVHRNNVHVVTQHPVTTGLTDSWLSNWNDSIHYRFTVYPADFHPLAIDVDNGSDWSGADGIKGYPYVLVRGEGDLAGYNPTPPETYGDPEFGADAADPVSTTYGNYHDTYVDLPATAGLYGMTVERGYNSLDSTSGVLGVGWRSPYSETATAATNGVVTVTRSDGRRVRFLPDGSGGWVQPLGFNGVIAKDPDNSYRVDFPEGEQWFFDTLGRLEKRQLWDGQNVTLARDGSGRVTTATSSSGPTVTFAYGTSGASNGRLISATASDGRSVSYGYGGATNSLSSVTNPAGKSTAYLTDAAGRVTKVTDPTGVVVAENTYDPVSGRVSQQSTPLGTITFAYDFTTDNTTVTHVGLSQTVIYHHDSQGRVDKITDQNGAFLTRAYGPEGYPTTSTNQTGEQEVLGRNAKGLPSSMSDPEMGTVTFTYDGSNRVTAINSPVRGTTTLGYSGSSRVPSTITDQYGKTTTNTLNGSLITSTTDADGVKYTYTYNSLRQAATVVDLGGRTTTFGYDAAGRQTSVTSPQGRVTATSYDAMGRPLTKTANDGGTVTYTYDDAGRQLTMTDQLGKTAVATYDPVTGQLATTKLPGKPAATYTYDAAGRIKQVTDPSGVVTKSEYDALGRVKESYDGANRKTSYGYDTAGRLTSTTAPDTGVWTTTFNNKGQVAGTTDGETRATTYTYKPNGLPLTVVAPGGATTTYGYDDMGRLLSVTDAAGVVSSTTYTDAGRTATSTEAGVTTTYGYDNAGRRTSITTPAGTQAISYWDDGMVKAATSPLGRVTGYAYDPVGRLETVTDPAGVVTTYTWTLRGQLATSHLSGRGTVTTTYNDDGTIAAVQNPLLELTTFGYDNAGRMTSRTTPQGTETWGYTNGEVTSYTPIPIPGQPTGVETYGRDAAGRVNSITDGAGRAHATTYNKAGDITGELDADGAAALARGYEYDNAGRQWKVTTPDGVTTRSFDPAGRLTSETAPGSRSTVWGYDAFGRTSQVVAPDGTDLRYSYDTAGRLVAVGGPPQATVTDGFGGADGTAPDPAKWATSTTGWGSISASIGSMTLQTPFNGGTAKLRSKPGPTRDTDQSVSVAFLSTSPWFPATVSLSARTQANGDGYRIEVRSDSWTAYVKKRVGGVDTTLGSMTVPLGNPMRFRLAVDGTSIKAKVWTHGNSEPTAWNYSGNDASIAPAGENDVSYASGTANIAYIDDYQRVTNPSSATYASWSYNADSDVTSETLPGGSRTHAYDATTGQVSQSVQSLPGANRTTSFTYDTAGAIKTTATSGVTSTYSYDTASQLTGVAVSSGTGAQSFTYENGRVKTATVGSTTTTNTYDARSRLLTAAPAGGNTTTYTYNGAGDRLTETTGTNSLTYGYDPAGRLSTTQRATSGTPSKTTTRKYNAENLISSYSVAGAGGANLGTYGIDWDLTSPIPQPLQFTDSTSPTGTLTLAGDSTTIAATIKDNNATAVAVDGLGSAIPSTGQSVAYGSDYDAWGRASTPSTSNAQRLGYRNELTIDNQTSLRNRTYDPTSRQFTTVDPVGPTAGAGTDATLYHYAANNPINLIDPLGLSPSDDRNPMDDDWDVFVENDIGGVDDFVVGLVSQAFGNVWGMVKGVGTLTVGAGECAASYANGVPLLGAIVPDGWNCDNLNEQVEGITAFASEIWDSISGLFTEHDQKALSYFMVSLGEVVSGVNMGDCLLTPNDDHDHYNTYAYCIGAFIGGGLTNYLVAGGIGKAALNKLRSEVLEASETATARFVAGSEGIVDTVGGSRNAVSLGHYPAYIDDAAATGSRTFSMSDDAWNAMSQTEQRLRNQRFLDDAIARGSEIRLATPLDQVRPDSFYEWELQYLTERGYVPSADGTRMVPR